MHISAFDYHLPPTSIAQTPTEPRDHSKLLVLNRTTGAITHHHFYDLPTLLKPTDVLVVNNSKTMPMRVFGTKTSGGAVELLFIKKTGQHETTETWEVLSKPGLKVGQEVAFANSTMHLKCTQETGYTRLVELSQYDHSVFAELHRIGKLPTPHYIRTYPKNPERYQTIYAKPEGSAATPTAGLHFTQDLFEKLNKKSIQVVELTLHVGLGTFLPVKEEQIEQHAMHSEWYTLTPEVAETLNRYKLEGRRIIAVGTTTTRVLETCATEDPQTHQYLLKPNTGETTAFYYPPHQFHYVDALITNFHLPKSTLLMLISAFACQNTPFTTFAESSVGHAYAQAIQSGYRFYSFGDAMMIE